MLNFEARDANEDAVDEKYVPSYNAALLISMLKKTFFPNSKLNPKLIDTYRTFEAASNPRVGDIVDAIATDLMNTDKRYLKYASLHEGLQGVLYNQYISRVSKKKPENALLAFGDALRELGITGILEIKLNDALASIPSAKALAEAKGAPAKSSSLKVAGKEELALLYFIDLYNIISKGTGAIFKSGTMFRLPREIVKNQIKAMPNGLIDSDKTVGDVVDIWNMSIQEYVDANTSRLTGLQRSAALLALLGAGYLFVRYRD
jgi:hypothetical protein